MLGDFSEGSTSARFHLMGRDRDSFTQCSKRESLHFLPTTWSRKALQLIDGGGGQGERGSYTAAVDGQEQEGQWAVIPYQGPESRHIQAKVLQGQREGAFKSAFLGFSF